MVLFPSLNNTTNKLFLLSSTSFPTHEHLRTHAHTLKTTENMGSVVLPHLNTGWHVDQAILSGKPIAYPHHAYTIY